MFEQRLRSGGEILQPRARRQDHIGLAGERVGRRRAGDADAAERERIVPGQRPCRPASRRPAPPWRAAKAISVGLARLYFTPPPAMISGRWAPRSAAAAAASSSRSGAGLRQRTIRRSKKRRREICGLDLDILRQAQRHRPAFGRIGQHPERLGQRRDQLLRPIDAVEIARHRPEAVIGRGRRIADHPRSAAAPDRAADWRKCRPATAGLAAG